MLEGREQLERLTQECLARYRDAFGERLVSLALFGSQARGTATASSDIDLYLIVQDLVVDRYERHAAVTAPLDGLSSISVLGRTPEDFERDITPLHLDLALDARLIFDRDGYLAKRLKIVRQRIEEAGTYRDSDLFWRWRQTPRIPDWAIRWDGVEV
jgi:predicted nucleotidyltransferase